MCSLQDELGFMWFGTKDGLNRFDGYTFKTFRKTAGNPHSIGNNFIHSLFEDKKGRLWVGTDKGLYQYNKSSEQFSLVLASRNKDILEIGQDKNGNLWLISNLVLYRYVEQTGKLQHYNQALSFNATALCTTKDGTLWVATTEGQLKKYIPEKDTFTDFDLFQHSKPNAGRWIESLNGTESGTLIAGTSDTEIKLFDPVNLTYTDLTLTCSKQPNLYIRSIQQTAPNEYWLGTESGVFVYNTKTAACIPLTKDYSNPYSITDNAVYTFCRDREGGVWVGTYFGGINYFPKQNAPFTKYFPRKGENSLSGNVVREIQKDPNGNLWIGTEDAGLNKFNPKTGHFTHFVPGNSGLSFFNIHALMTLGNELWIGTFHHGLDVMDTRTSKVIRHIENEPGSDWMNLFIYCLYQLSPAEILIGTPSGLYKYDRKKDKINRFQGFPPWIWYSSILKDSKGTIWTGSFGRGVHYFNPATGKSGNFTYKEQDDNSLSSDRVNAIYEDSKKNLWFATEEGLCKWNPVSNNFTRYGTANGFPSDFMLSILEDSQQKLWISTTKGLVCFTASTGKVEIFTSANGLLSDQFNYNAAFKDEDGRMYFGSAKGLISFQPEEFSQNKFIPPIYLTGFQVNNQEMDISGGGSTIQKSKDFTREVTLTHDQSTISLDFAALGYTAPERIQYSYKMEGLSNQWVDLKTNRRVYFLELPAGTYTFRVKASNQNENFSPQETRLRIVILPPWWANGLAKMTYSVITILLVFFFIRTYHRRMEEKNRRKLEILQMKKEKEILAMQLSKEKELLEAKVDFFTNVAHEIRTPLTLIKLPLTRIIKKMANVGELANSVKIMERNTNRLIDLTNQLLDFRQTEINKFHLAVERANISSLLEEASTGFSTLAEQKNIMYSLYLPKTTLFANVDVDAFNKIIYNLLSNAVKYAASKVEISLLTQTKDKRFFTIEVKSDGYLVPEELKEKIFEPFFRIRDAETQPATGTGIGLALARSLAQLHEGSLVLELPQDEMNVFSLTLPVQLKKETLSKNSSDNYNEISEENTKK